MLTTCCKSCQTCSRDKIETRLTPFAKIEVMELGLKLKSCIRIREENIVVLFSCVQGIVNFSLFDKLWKSLLQICIPNNSLQID